MAKLFEGDPAPNFALPASNGKDISLNEFHGKKNLVVYFYPKDDTPGCTVQACGFRDKIKPIEARDAIVLGVSSDGLKTHDKFIKKFVLPFLLLSDPDHKMSEDYGVWGEKKFMGRKYMGINRTTFIIDKEGKILKIFEKVKPEGHNEEVLNVLKSI